MSDGELLSVVLAVGSYSDARAAGDNGGCGDDGCQGNGG